MIDWAEGSAERNYGIKREMDKRNLWELLRVIVTILVVAGILLFYSWIRSQILAAGYLEQQLQVKEQALLRSQRSLLLEEATLTSPERIDRIARNDLGLNPLRPVQLIAPEVRHVDRTDATNLAMSVGNSPEPQERDSN
jgi:cell division protein FtsL